MTEKERIDSIKRNGGQHLKNFKRENITYGMCLAAVEKDGSALQYVPMRDQRIYTEACRSQGNVLAQVPKEVATEEMYSLAVADTGTALQFVPTDSKTPELCRKAALNAPEAFAFIPREYITPELCLASLKAQAKPKWDIEAPALRNVPEKHKTEELLKETGQSM